MGMTWWLGLTDGLKDHSTMIGLLLMMLLAAPAFGASVHKCTQPDGSVTYSDSACPKDTVERESRGHTGRSSQENAGAYNPYSVTEQARPIGERNRSEQRSRQGRTADAARPQQPADQQPAMTYKEARARAMDDAGYRQYGRLTKAQRDRVHRAMAKYNHLRPPPRKTAEQQPEEAAEQQPDLFVNGILATPVGGGNYIDSGTGHFLQGAAGGVIDTTKGEFMPVH